MPLQREGSNYWTYRELAEDLGVDSTTVRRRAKRLGVRVFRARTKESGGQLVCLLDSLGAHVIREYYGRIIG